MGEVSAEPAQVSVCLQPGLHLADNGSGVFAIASSLNVDVLGRLSAPEVGFVRSLAAPQAVDEIDDQFLSIVDRLRSNGWLTTHVGCGLRQSFAVEHRPSRGDKKPPEQPLKLSRFASVRRSGEVLHLECPTASAQIILYDLSLAPIVLDPSFTPEVQRDAAELLRSYLVSTGFYSTEVEETDFRFSTWSAHELSFHSNSRLRQDHNLGQDFGGSHWARGRFPPLPGRHPDWTGPLLELPTSTENSELIQSSLVEVLHRRRSRREYDETSPPTIDQLGCLLQHVAAVRDTFTVEGLELSRRPYPSGGSVFELEIYPLVRQVSDLDCGLFHYDPFDHGLRRVPADRASLNGLMSIQRANLADAVVPQVVFLISARFGRLGWKYQSMAYALTLKHVGVLYQTFYLVSTALGLAPCALGVGNADMFSAVTGLNYFDEPSVGEFALGSARSTKKPA